MPKRFAASPSPFTASRIESPLVKSLHPIHEIAQRLSEVDGHWVRLVRSSATDDKTPNEASAGATVSTAPEDAAIAALAQPIDYPPLEAGIVPGDQVAIAVDETTPCAAAIVRGTIKSLQSAGVENEAITVVASNALAIESCREMCVEQLAAGVRFILHDPSDEKNLCMVGMTKGGVPMVVNREIFEADVVLPIGCAHVDDRGVFESLFPRFSSSAAIEKYRTPTAIESPTDRSDQRREIKQAGWQIGAPMVVRVVPGPGESVSHVLAGETMAVGEKAHNLASQQWAFTVPHQVNLMIATINGGPESQTWANVARALAMAEHLVIDGGAVAICSNLSQPPGPSLGRLIGNPDLEKVIRKVANEHDTDSWPAWQLARALQRGPVYFLSQLDEETVENLGMAPVESIDEIVRLAEHYETFAVVEDVQNAVVTLAESTDDF